MAKTILTVLFTVSILLSAAFLTSSMVESAEALKAQGNPQTQGAKSFGSKNAGIVCGDKLCSEERKTATPKPESQTACTMEYMPVCGTDGVTYGNACMMRAAGAQLDYRGECTAKPKPMACTKEYMPVCGTDGVTYGNACMMKAAGAQLDYKGECKAAQPETAMHKSTVKSGTMASIQDPALGHESHQLAVILPPSDKIYKGTLSFAASEPVQLVALHGPLAEGEDKGQPIWTPDGKTKFALTIVDPQQAGGTWNFAGNALAVHTRNAEPFTVSYTVNYMEKTSSETVKSGTMASIQDPALGHESHQLAVILPPSDKPYSGIVAFAASEPVQLVALHGPLAEGEDKGQPIWTPDGKTKFALTIVDPQQAGGTWNFAGNALAVHTRNAEPFTVSYTVVSSQ